ncbi:hypothetical protein C0081_03700 [Cohaesibacter celericrescens]|uniref:Uncharacterized protein n=1 Tax=Cohaesibacter celericrescens TaxID=2067669 RepID=A0A2N5XVW9_9HYPH|nr:hypothetical protein C0081_03700 [Cohaesibacter celericrescens]
MILLCALKRESFRIRVFTLFFRQGEGTKAIKASKFSNTQKAFILKLSDDCVPVAEIYRKVGISQATISTGKEVWWINA